MVQDLQRAGRENIERAQEDRPDPTLKPSSVMQQMETLAKNKLPPQEKQESYEPKISIVEIIVIGLFLILGEVGEIVADFSIGIPVIGEISLVFSRVYGGVLSLFILPYLIIKGVGIHWYLGGSFLGVVIPLGRTGAFIATVIEDHLPPKVKSAVSVAEKVTNPIAK